MKKFKRMVALLLSAVMITGMLAGCGNGGGKDDYIHLTIYSQLANYSGEMQGWFAQILKDQFGVIVNLIPETGGVLDTRMEAGDLGDIVIWGSDGKDYKAAVAAGLLYDWEEDELVQEYGPYIWEHMQDALNKNKEVSAPEGQEGTTIYGFAHNVASSSDSHDAFFYTWDIRWDLYQQLGHPEVNNMDDMLEVLKQMKEICPTDDNGKTTYAMSIWPDWDGNMVMYVKALATAYYGYDEFGFGHYNVENGEFYDCLADDSPYLEMLEWFNKLYREGLLDPDSMTQTYDEMIAKVQTGGVFFSIFNYAGSLAYNKENHYGNNQIMESLTPTEASPIVAGLSTLGSNRIWSIGAKTQYPEKCMEILNWLCTPEGRLTMDYGPQGLCWDYDDNNKTYFTDFGKICFEDRTTMMPDEWGGATFNDGAFQPNNTTWVAADINPVSGEPYDQQYWASTQVEGGRCEAEADWRAWSGCITVDEYMNSGNYCVDIPTTYSESEMDAELEAKWNQVATCITNGSWKAIYATSEEEFASIVADMKNQAKGYGYDECVEFSRNEAAIKNALQAPLRNH